MASLQEQIDELKEDIKELRKEIGNLKGKVSETNTELTKTDNIFGNILKRTTEVGKNLLSFTKDLKEQYILAEEQAKAYFDISKNIGLSTKNINEFGVGFIRANAKVTELGGGIEDVKEIFKSFASESGRARIINPEEVESIYALGNAVSLYGSSATKMFETFELMGKSVSKTAGEMDDLIVNSRKQGLNTAKVFDTLSSNLETMQTYSFRDGVRGMTKMAQLAVKMRMDVGEMLSMADKFYEPEAAIEAAANLQMLGGDIAAAFGDPFETMYLARNKPEELAERVGKMVENMMTFNEETQEYEFPPEARMQLKAAGDQLNINTNSMIEMARQSAKIKDIKMNVSGDIADPEMREGLASMARMKDGKWVVDFKDQTGEKVTRAIEDLTSGDAEFILSQPTDERGAAIETARNTMTMSETLDNIEKAGKLGIISKPGTNIYMELEKLMKPTFNELSIGMNNFSSAAGESLGKDGYLKQALDTMQSATSIGGGTAADFVKKTFEDLNSLIVPELETEMIKLKTETFDLTGEMEKLRKVINTINVTANPTPNVSAGGQVNVPQPTTPNVNQNQTPNVTNQNDIVMNFYGVSNPQEFRAQLEQFYNEFSGAVPS